MLDIFTLLFRCGKGKNISLSSLSKRKQEGFSILEVLVTILVLTGFILGSLQATVLATLLRVQAQDKQEAANWIQQDLELIRYQAFMLDNGTADPATCGSYGLDLLNDTNFGLLQPTSSPRFPGVIDPATGVPQQSTINGRNYNVFRVYRHNNTNILQINYTVAYAPTHPRYNSSAPYTGLPASDNPNLVTTLSTEVLPNAALGCN